MRYLERDSVTRADAKGRAYSAIENEADSKAFIERGRDDSHQFRFIVAPEDAADMADLRSFTRDLIRKMEADLGTDLDWIAVDHHNTGHPHTHVIVRGVLDDGRILNIAGDYIAHGVRRWAQELVTLELGPQTETELRPASSPTRSGPNAGPASTRCWPPNRASAALSTFASARARAMRCVTIGPR